jgi:hypothetical protein
MMPTSLSKIKQWLKDVCAVRMNPHRYWMLLLRIFFGIFVCLTIGSFYLLHQIKIGEIFQVNQASDTANAINQDLLQSVTASLDQKAQAQSQLKASPAAYPDPGL